MKLTTRWLLSAACAAVTTCAVAQGPPELPDMTAILSSLSTPCAKDIKTTCAGKEGMDQMMCLLDHQDKLTPSCKDAMAKLPQPGR